ncbi:hypothetical protein LCGC14_2527550 [marine sediment metagenome]|uniref:DUF5131 family protein n=1 Tax=marine sediment metagenome TaxID=412755 RepID=A0A0F9DMV6_9ZZZZ
MMLKKQKGNMYEFVTHMWSPVRGKCSHDCSYCYMKKYGEQPPLHVDEKELMTDLGEDNFIFVCYTCDLFAKDVPGEWILKVLEMLRIYRTNRYLLQSKNPKRFLDFIDQCPDNGLWGTTIETNRDIYVYSKAPPYIERARALHLLHDLGHETMVTIEPILDFDVDELVELVLLANPTWVNIGADSKGHGLPEPSPEKVTKLVKALQEKTDVKLKRNLKRICSDLQIQQRPKGVSK